MQLQVLLERVSDKKFRVTGGIPLALVVEGESEEEAVRNYQDAIAARLINGGKLLSLDLPDQPIAEHPWMKFAGTLPDDELTAEWRRSIEDFRREADDTDN